MSTAIMRMLICHCVGQRLLVQSQSIHRFGLFTLKGRARKFAARNLGEPRLRIGIFLPRNSPSFLMRNRRSLRGA